MQLSATQQAISLGLVQEQLQTLAQQLQVGTCNLRVAYEHMSLTMWCCKEREQVAAAEEAVLADSVRSQVTHEAKVAMERERQAMQEEHARERRLLQQQLSETQHRLEKAMKAQVRDKWC